MLPSRAFPSSGRLTFSFERLYCTIVKGGEADYRPVYGFAEIAFDGRGNWWPETITCHDRRFGRPDFVVDYASPFWREIAERLAGDRAEEIEAAITIALGPQGKHMALFGEHLPPETVRRPAPPHVPAGFRRVPSTIAGAAVICSEFLAFALLVAAIVALCTIPQLPRPASAQLLPHPRGLTAVATLEEGKP